MVEDLEDDHKIWSKFIICDMKVLAAFTGLLIFFMTGTIVYHYLEGWSWVSSFYFSVSTLATVGYGDLHPTSDLTRLFTTFYIILGVANTIVAFGVIGDNYLQRREERLTKTIYNRRFRKDKNN